MSELIFSDGKRMTPLGPMYVSQIQALEELKVWKHKEGDFTLIPHKVSRDGRDDVWIPIAFFNLEFYIKKFKDLQKAIAILAQAPLIYLPDIEGKNSYSQLFNSIGNE